MLNLNTVVARRSAPQQKGTKACGPPSPSVVAWRRRNSRITSNNHRLLPISKLRLFHQPHRNHFRSQPSESAFLIHSTCASGIEATFNVLTPFFPDLRNVEPRLLPARWSSARISSTTIPSTCKQSCRKLTRLLLGPSTLILMNCRPTAHQEDNNNSTTLRKVNLYEPPFPHLSPVSPNTHLRPISNSLPHKPSKVAVTDASVPVSPHCAVAALPKRVARRAPTVLVSPLLSHLAHRH